jgi:hypothetical protein
MYEYICILSPPNIMGLPRHDDIIRAIFISRPYSYMPIGFGWNKRYSILFYSILNVWKEKKKPEKNREKEELTKIQVVG